jgi:acyl carrier protein
LRNQKWAIVNEQGEEVPDWVTGQLMIGGDGVALGYWRDEERTRKSFWKDGEGVRWYRTGDLGRYLGGGAIEFLGREDHQVKVNGYRIELGEVESAIGSYEGVKEGVVLAVGEPRGNRQLAAYVVFEEGRKEIAGNSVNGNAESARNEQTAALRAFLSKKLPEYMLPSIIVVLDRLPLSSNGKVNRQALPLPGDSPQAERKVTAPRNPLEEQLTGIWKELLARDRIGIDDSFFEIGGDSVLAIQLINRIRDVFGIDIPLRQFFEDATIAAMAEYVETFNWAAQGLPEALTAGEEEYEI